MLEPHHEAIFRERFLHTLRPLHSDHARAPAQHIPTQRIKIIAAMQSIRIDVHQRRPHSPMPSMPSMPSMPPRVPDPIHVHQDKRRALNRRVLDAESARHPANKTRLPRPKIAVQRHRIAGAQHPAEPAGDRLCLLLAFAQESFDRARHRQSCSHPIALASNSAPPGSITTQPLPATTRPMRVIGVPVSGQHAGTITPSPTQKSSS